VTLLFAVSRLPLGEFGSSSMSAYQSLESQLPAVPARFVLLLISVSGYSTSVAAHAGWAKNASAGPKMMRFLINSVLPTYDRPGRIALA
jgi:hypothetical protein